MSLPLAEHTVLPSNATRAIASSRGHACSTGIGAVYCDGMRGRASVVYAVFACVLALACMLPTELDAAAVAD
ncbi:MAG: hypothetical protein K0S65_5222 [Labilithrix sp.]|nr:hypothetical protein [Labilithrix sp.]